MKTKTVMFMFLLLGGLALAPKVWAFPAAPTLSDVDAMIVNLDGTAYYDVEAIMNGTGVIPNSLPYNVPVKFLYPVDPNDCNGTGLVDLYNNSGMVLLSTEGEGVPFHPLESARARMTDEFFGREGYFYAGVQWEKSRGVIELLNEYLGTTYAIPNDADQFAIILDASTALRTPPAGLPGSPCAVSTVAGYGMSASTVPFNILKQPALSGPQFAAAFAALYDGVIWDSITAGFLPFPISKTGVKTIAVSAETDVQLFRNDLLVRGENPEYRAYEVAGVTHVSIDQHNLDQDVVPLLPDPLALPTRQNLATHSPVFRAMMEHLRAWITDGTPPPPSVYLDGSNYAVTPIVPACIGLPIPGVAQIPRDADGNALGGIRLPFLKTKLNPNCSGNFCLTIGSPLGVYNGMELQYGCKAGGFPQVAIVTGTFIRSDDILDRYHHHLTYLLGVAAAAENAYLKGWILKEDRNEYIATALHCRVGRDDSEDITMDDLKACHGL